MAGVDHKKRRAGAEDVEIGRKIRALRLERGLSQSGLAKGIDLTFQQVQKYEMGTNRVSAGRLQRIADILGTPVMFFYGGMGVHPKKQDQRNSSFRLPPDQGRHPAAACLFGNRLAHDQVRAGGARGIPASAIIGPRCCTITHHLSAQRRERRLWVKRRRLDSVRIAKPH